MDNRIVEILQHKIGYYYEEDQKMPECEQDHVKEMIIEDYCEGELNCVGENDIENAGWWWILR